MAVGCLGMSLDDFCSCTPLEFHHVYEAWQQREERIMRTSWEQTRALMQSVLQPHSKKHLSATEILPLPWDKKEKSPTEPISDEDIAARYEAARKKYGMQK